MIKSILKNNRLVRLRFLFAVLFVVNISAMRMTPKQMEQVKRTFEQQKKKEQQELQRVMAKKCNSLILIFDPELNEGIDAESDVLALTFMDAVREKVAPIIVSSNIVENFCFWKIEHKQLLDAVKQEVLKTKNIDLAKQKALNLLKEIEKAKRFEDEDGNFSVLLSMIDLSGNDWNCYMHRQADLVLLVPKNYDARGFNVTNLDEITNLSPSSVLEYIQVTKKTTSSINIVDAVKSMFKIEKSSDETQRASWNIFISGHGGPAQKKKIIK